MDASVTHLNNDLFSRFSPYNIEPTGQSMLELGSVAIHVDDLDAAIEKFSASLGWIAWHRIDTGAGRASDGPVSQFATTRAIAQLGPIDIELIQCVGAPLDRHGPTSASALASVPPEFSSARGCAVGRPSEAAGSHSVADKNGSASPERVMS